MSRERERSFDEIGKKIKRESDAVLQTAIGGGGARRHIQLGPPGTTLNTVTPCAACKLLRRRCAQECPFSPYFSPHEPQKFASVHKVFGASNVSKMLMEVPENQRADAANSLVYEANVRLRDPVYGCMGAISALQQEFQLLQAELSAVRAEILKYKFREVAANVVANTTATSTNNNNNNINITITNNNNNNNNNNNTSSATSHVAFLPSGAAVSIAVPPPPPTLSPVVPGTSPPPPSHVHDDHSNTSISSSMFTQSSGGADHYSSISNENISYFD